MNLAKICIIGLGPGDINSLTLGAVEKINDGNRVYLRTEKHPTVGDILYTDRRLICCNTISRVSQCQLPCIWQM